MAYNGVPTESDKDLQSLEGAVLSVSLKGTPPSDPNRKRSQSLVIKAGKNVLMPDVGTASEVAMAAGDMGRDDMYIEGISLRRGFASEFVAMLEDDARKLFLFDEDDFEDESETTALRPYPGLERRSSTRSQAAMARVIVTFLKSMVGSYILYTPKMFANGGVFAAVVTLLIAAWVACDNMIVLIKLAEYTGKNSYGQLGFAAFGKWGQVMVDVSLVLSQLSFCCSYFIFIVLNIPSVAPTPERGSLAEYVVSPDVLIAFQLLVYIPMAWIRHLKYLALAMFAANVCMWLGLLLITSIDVGVLFQHGAEPVQLYNPDTFILFLGAVVVCFEGIGLVLPLRNSMDPLMQHKFPGVVRVAMFFLAIVFSLFGSLGYLAYGRDIETFVTMNIPRGDPLGTLSVGLYSVAIMMTYPLQLFPAIKCLEGFAGRSFDNFAGLIGGFCAVPLALVYPSAFLLHLMGDTLSVAQRLWTWTVLLGGCVAAVLCTWQSLATWK